MYSIIINPLSGKGLAARTLPALETLLCQMGIGYRVDQTVRMGDSRRLARKAAEDGLAGVIAVGGDGTFFEVVNGIGESGLEVIFAPCGTGNDFVKTFELPRGMVNAVRAQLKSPRRKIDIGRLNDMYFLNVAGAGFDVDVLIEADRFKSRFRGMMAYLLGALCAIKRLKPLKLMLEVDGGAARYIESTILSVGNGRYIGGGMKALPHAIADDGLFDVVVSRRVNKFSIAFLLLFFVLGVHVRMKWLCETFRCKRVRLTGEGIEVEADGERFSAGGEAEFSILPRALNTRLPE
ncbi:MAG: diacylglycerol/lipid kinase family protein [Christensenellales bacterium]|jgi:diacylglycerol kinase (ATP)